MRAFSAGTECPRPVSHPTNSTLRKYFNPRGYVSQSDHSLDSNYEETRRSDLARHMKLLRTVAKAIQ